ncbi:MAG: hypothetical protein ACLGHQ_15850, partial [Acidimicrobiia bacterium]
ANVLIGAAMDAIAPIVLASGALCLWWINDDRTIPQSTTRWMVGILLIFSACERSRKVAFGDHVNSRWVVGVLLA